MQVRYPPICRYCKFNRECGSLQIYEVPLEVSIGLFDHRTKVADEPLTFMLDRKMLAYYNMTLKDLSEIYFSDLKSSRKYMNALLKNWGLDDRNKN